MPVGQGKVDWQPIIETIIETDLKYAFAE